jgi:hypothetical protein
MKLTLTSIDDFFPELDIMKIRFTYKNFLVSLIISYLLVSFAVILSFIKYFIIFIEYILVVFSPVALTIFKTDPNIS